MTLNCGLLKNLLILCLMMALEGCFSSVSKKIIDHGDMVFIEGGTFESTDPQSKTPKTIIVKSFYLDKNLVTVAEFDDFVRKTNYKTEAEKFGNSALFDFDIQNWLIKDSVDYHFPFGRDKEKSKPNHPVTHVSWHDAMAYAKWKGKRLPTDAEWEYAAQNAGQTNYKYAWGNELIVNNHYKANAWQGQFPVKNSGLDGFLTTSPVGIFGPNEIGLFDMGGNVWQWVSDTIIPTGNDYVVDPSPRRVLRGGCFLTDPEINDELIINSRSSSTPETSMVHTGFRCAKNAD